MTIRSRILLGFLLIVGIIFTSFISWVVRDMRLHYLKSMEETLIDTATLLSSFIARDIDQGGMEVKDIRALFDQAFQRTLSARVYDITKRTLNCRVYVTDARGVVIFDSAAGRDEGKDYSSWKDVALTLSGKYGARATRLDPDDPDTSTLYIASPILVNDVIMGVVTVGKPAMSVSPFIALAKRQTIVVGLIAGAGVILLGTILSIWVTSPLNTLTAYARRVRNGEKVALPLLASRETRILGRALDDMREALEGKQYVEHYVQALTHQLKNPLAAIKGAAEILKGDVPPQKDRFLDNIRLETERMQLIIQRLLDLAALEKRQSLENIEQIALDQLLHELITSFAQRFEEKSITLDVPAIEKIRFSGEKFLIRQALDNLVQNALDFSPAGGCITIRSARPPTTLVLTVEDEGPGIPDYAFSHLFERFYSLPRPDSQRKSSGLGLCLVHEIAELHHGSISLANRAPAGTAATLSFPLHHFPFPINHSPLTINH